MRNYIIEFLLSFLVIIFVTTMFLLMLHAAAIASDNPAYEKPEVDGPYQVIVTFSNLDDYIKLTGASWIDREVVAALFRNNGRELGKKNIFLVSFNRPMNSEQVTREMSNLGLYPATLLMVTALGVEKYNDVFPGHPVVALGSYCHDYRGELCVPQLWQYWGKKKMSLVPAEDGWRTGTRFAAIRY